MSVLPVARIRLTAILGSLCAIFALVAIRELGASTQSLSRDILTPPPAIQADAAAAAAFSLPPLQSFAVVTERPLFSPSRQPAPASSNELDAWSSFVLAGIIISPDLREAMVLHNQPPMLVNLQEGEAIDGWTVANIFPDHAVFRNGDAEHELKLNLLANSKTSAAPEPRRTAMVPGRLPPPSRGFGE
jgi:type II secretory pathway component PulC